MPTRGPLPPAVYWRRRLMLGGTAVLLVVAGVDLVNGEEGPPPAGSSAQQVAGEVAPSADRTTQAVVIGPRAGERRRRAGQDRPAYTPPPAPEPPDPVGECADAEVLVTPVMSSAVAGRPVLVSLSLRTSGTRACTWQLGPGHLAYNITADGEDVWSSSDCPREVPEDAVVVRRDFTTTYRLAWSGRESSRDCPGGMDHAAPGEYEVQASAIGGEPSDPVPFELTAPVEPTPLGPEVPEADDATGADGRGRKGAVQQPGGGRQPR